MCAFVTLINMKFDRFLEKICEQVFIDLFLLFKFHIVEHFASKSETVGDLKWSWLAVTTL